jgi:hypothetical protein
MGKLGIVYRHEDGKMAQVDMRAWDFAPWVKEKLGRAVRNQLLLRHPLSLEERTRVEERIASGQIDAESADAWLRRRKAEALLDLLDGVAALGEVFLERGLVVLEPKGIDVDEVPTTRMGEAELEALRPRGLV